MWSFIKTFLACFFAMIFFFMFIVLFITAIAAMGGSGKTSKTLNKKGILELDLNYEVREKGPENPLNISFGQISYSKKLGLYEILKCLKSAKDDANVEGIYIHLGASMDCGYATVEAIRNELIEFKKSGKFVVAYGDVSSQKYYYLASVATKIYINPIGGIDFRGFGGQVTFLKGMLDKLNIETQVYYAGKFKSATEPFRYTQMSEPNKQQVREYLTDFSNIVLPNISAARNISLEKIQEAINSMKVTIPESAKEHGFIDDAIYYDQVLTQLNTMNKKGKDDKINFIKLATYYKSIKEDESDEDNKVAVIVAEGDIVDGKGDEESIGGDKFAEIVRDIRNDEDVKAVVLRVNSGGGSVLASDIIWRELEMLKSKKMVVTSMGDVAASGGYYIASGSTRIFAQPNTITGSIGVFGVVPNLQKFFNDKLGVTFDEVELNDHAVMNINKPLDDFEANFIQTRINKIYQDFITIVSKGRYMSVANVDSIAQGRVWSGKRAKELGLVDEIGSLQNAVDYAVKVVKLKNYSVEIYPQEKDPFTNFITEMEDEVSKIMIKRVIEKEGLTEEFKYLKLLNKYKNYAGIKMELPMYIELN